MWAVETARGVGDQIATPGQRRRCGRKNFWDGPGVGGNSFKIPDKQRFHSGVDSGLSAGA